MTSSPDPFVSVGVVEAQLADVLREHAWEPEQGQMWEDFIEPHCRCGWEIEDEDAFDHEDHQASAVVAAVRGMTAQQQAELTPMLAANIATLNEDVLDFGEEAS